MAATIFLGLEGKTYIQTTGARATWTASPTNGVYLGAAPGSLSEMAIIRNVTLGLSGGEADVSTRASIYKLMRKSLRTVEVDLEIPWQPGDANFKLLLQSYLQNGVPVALAVLDGDKATSGSQGLWADFEVFEFTRDENQEKEMIAKVKVKPTASAVPPEWVQVQ